MNPDTVYALLVEANPVPDPNAATIEPLRDLNASPSASHTVELTTLEPGESAMAPRQRHRWMPAAAAATIVIVAIGALVLTRSEPTPIDRAAAPAEPPPPTREERAVATAQAFYTALNAGDVDTMIAMTNPDSSVVEADRQMWEMNAVHVTLGEPWTIGTCQPVEITSSIEVACSVTINDPVFEQLGVNELIAPIRIFDDQTTRWLPFRGADFNAANRAYSDYLQAFHPDQYQAACSPAAYDPGTINATGGLALTASCGELWVPLGDDVAQWLRDDKPRP